MLARQEDFGEAERVKDVNSAGCEGAKRDNCEDEAAVCGVGGVVGGRGVHEGAECGGIGKSEEDKEADFCWQSFQ